MPDRPDPVPLWQRSATALSAAMHAGELSAAEVTAAALSRMDAVNPALNAVVDRFDEAARATATARDTQTTAKGPLHGVPVTIKVNVDQVGRATTNGVTGFRDVIARSDAPVVRNLLAAGAVIIGRTATPEFSFRAETDSPLYGPTRNPWGDHVSAGGSSGGAGSAVMAGIGALAHGNDIGGSLRFPAAANGGVTLKPGLGRVPAWNPSQSAERGILAQSMSVQGLIARNAADLRLAMPSLIATDPGDPFHVPLPWDGPRLSGPVRVAVARDDFGLGLDPQVGIALDRAAQALARAGYAVEEAEPPLVQEAAETGYRALLTEVRALLGTDIARHGSAPLQAIFEEYYRIFPPFDPDALLMAMGERTRYARAWAAFQETYPLILTPFLLTPFFPPGRDTEGADGVRAVLGKAHWSYLVNFLGLPAGNLPAHVADLPQGPQPIGVQIIGRRWREDLVVTAMEAIERSIPPVCTTLWQRMAASG